MNATTDISRLVQRLGSARLSCCISQDRGGCNGSWSKSGGSQEMLQKACVSYYRMLDEIYEKDMPSRVAGSLRLCCTSMARLADGAFRACSLVTGIMGDVRKQVGTMIKTLVSSFNEAGGTSARNRFRSLFLLRKAASTSAFPCGAESRLLVLTAIRFRGLAPGADDARSRDAAYQ